MADTTLANAPQIGGPDRIQPSAVQSDTFIQGERPYIDQNLARLGDALGHFNSNLQSLGIASAQNEALMSRIAKGKEANEEAEQRRIALEDFEYRRAKFGDEGTMNDIAGKADWARNPLIVKEIGAYYGQQLGRAKAMEIDKKIAAGELPLGDPSFNVEKYVLENSASEVQQLTGSPEGMKAYRQAAEHIRDSLNGKHNAAAGQAYVNQVEQIASDSFKTSLDAASKAGLTGTSLMEELRKTYDKVGVRIGGGSADVSNQKLDQLLLQQLNDAAKDPSKAPAVLSVLEAPRTGTDGRPVPPLSASPRNHGAIQSIQGHALKALQDQEKAGIEGEATNNAVASFMRGDYSINANRDQEITGGKTGVVVKLDDTKLKKEATRIALDQMRAANGGKIDLEKELPLFIRNDIKHPELTAAVENGVAGVGGANFKSPSDIPDAQLKSISDGYHAFHAADGISPSYSGRQFSKEAVGFYSAIDVMLDRGMTMDEATRYVAFRNSTRLGKQDDDLIKRRKEDILTQTKAIDFNGWWPGGQATNVGDLHDRVTQVAQSISQTDGIDPDKAVKKAVELVKKQAVNVNGNVVFGTALQKDDSAHVQTAINAIFEKNKEALKGSGITKADEMTIIPVGQDRFLLAKADRTGLVKADTPDGKLRYFEIGMKEVGAIRAAADTEAKDKQVKKAADEARAADEKYRAQYGMSGPEKFFDNAKRIGAKALDNIQKNNAKTARPLDDNPFPRG